MAERQASVAAAIEAAAAEAVRLAAVGVTMSAPRVGGTKRLGTSKYH